MEKASWRDAHMVSISPLGVTGTEWQPSFPDPASHLWLSSSSSSLLRSTQRKQRFLINASAKNFALSQDPVTEYSDA
ncbi:hypothetical protein CDAR_316891 [Caerostris darwini]|uniref:Uncharacterized protein n=1 Tax=Caerostris darwini TaxID=1538125 RepID=A0AAV4PZK8_9ARAC|nr:hypothetical protein CDAR_316891 [Caerostris darwini]